MSESRRVEAAFDACRQALLHLHGLIKAKKWNRLPQAEEAVASSMEQLQSLNLAQQPHHQEQNLESFRQLSRLHRNVMRDLHSQMQAVEEDQASVEEGMKRLHRLTRENS